MVSISYDCKSVTVNLYYVIFIVYFNNDNIG